MPDSGSATYREADAKSILRTSGITDPWFLARYGMNLYRGCEHGCLYCDGRAERYYVAGDFARDILVKRNALALLEREVARIREPGFLFLGGGVCDLYQPAESRYRLARGALELALAAAVPVHLLTKSALVERDLDLLSQINERRRAVLSFSIQTINEEWRRCFEPGAAPIAERWRLLAAAKARGLATGVMAMPVLPGLSDQPEAIRALVRAASDVGVDFVSYGCLTLRPGVQRQTYLDLISRNFPTLADGYARLYRSERSSGAPDHRYIAKVAGRFRTALSEAQLPSRIPRRVFRGLLPLYAEVAVCLEHRETELDRDGRLGPFGGVLTRSGFALQRWARGLLAHQRARDAYREVERELVRRSQDGSLVEVGVAREAMPVIRELLASPP